MLQSQHQITTPETETETKTKTKTETMSDRKKTGPKRLLKDAPITTPDHNTRNRNKNKNRNRNNVSNKSRQKETAPTVGRHKFLQLVHPVNL